MAVEKPKWKVEPWIPEYCAVHSPYVCRGCPRRYDSKVSNSECDSCGGLVEKETVPPEAKAISKAPE